MTPPEAAILASSGAEIYFSIQYLVTNIVLNGAFVLLVGIAIQLVITNPHKKRFKALWMAIIILTFIVATLDAIAKTAYDLELCKYTFIKNSSWINGGSSKEDTALLKSQVGKHTTVWLSAEVWLQIIPLLVSDCIVTWRAWVLWPNHKYVRAAFGVLQGANIASTGSSLPWDFSAIYLSLGVNVIMTSSIILKVWYFRKLLPQNYKRTALQKTLLLWAESGIVYCTAQNLAVNAQTDEDAVSLGSKFLTDIVVALGGIYTVFVFIAVNKEVSQINETVHLEYTRSQRVMEQDTSG
ncbi:hypothetical protein BDP27DRAFT_1403399 [Rhodocollybia butyracea]|uniref:Uncharacterized protein n=1 Tax=Rhodocollybia butyracea TaxID=206335 RepID=A0A9P5PTA6_9AGAR|nr:hypothetical protein BDP27DRAFT_1403399 [Rhodocollybia butyracea]